MRPLVEDSCFAALLPSLHARRFGCYVRWRHETSRWRPRRWLLNVQRFEGSLGEGYLRHLGEPKGALGNARYWEVFKLPTPLPPRPLRMPYQVFWKISACPEKNRTSCLPPSCWIRLRSRGITYTYSHIHICHYLVVVFLGDRTGHESRYSEGTTRRPIARLSGTRIWSFRVLQRSLSRAIGASIKDLLTLSSCEHRV